MLDPNALQKLQQLKQQIEEQKEHVEGVVKATNGRFGFVILDDKREIFLPPEQMLRVFPGDRVAICVQGGKDKPVAELERLIGTDIDQFTGRVVKKGDALFVEPDLPRFNRWLFLPPSARQGIQVGDYVSCRLDRHPFKHGKPQAQITEIIGSPQQPGIEARYVIAKYALAPSWPDAPLPSVDSERDARRDLRDLPFITIDAETTLDMDDALYAERGDNGWTLWVAIADPTAYVAPGSPWEEAARARGSAVYLPGQTLPMLPEDLVNNTCSLVPNEDRAALVARLTVADDGAIADCEFISALIRSRAKLSYRQCADHLIGNTPCVDHGTLIATLHQLTSARNQYRRTHHLVMQDRAQYRLVLDTESKISAIEREEKTPAHQVVEEAMVAVNCCAAQKLSQQPAVFVSHAGFRSERIGDLKRLLKEELPDIPSADARTLDGYVQLMRRADTVTTATPLRAIFSRWLERSQLSTVAKPHHGMGLTFYTTITSPLRKFSDFLTHRLLKATLGIGTTIAPSAAELLALQQRNETIQRSRQEMEQWLKCQYLAAQPQAVFSGEIVHIHAGGFAVRLDESGIEGSVEVPSDGQKYRFCAHRLQLTNDQRSFQLQQKVSITVAKIDSHKRTIDFALAPA